MAAAPPEFHLAYGWNDSVQVVEGLPDDLPSVIQAPPLPRKADVSYLEDLAAQYLAWDLDDCLGDVSECGHVLECTFREPVLWANTSLPEAVVQPTLPDAKTGEVGFEEVSVHDAGLTSADLQALQERIAAREPSTVTWHGFSVSMPFMPGSDTKTSDGGTGGAVSAAAAAARAEAETGAWLAEFERSGALPRVVAPGLGRGAFGGWAVTEAAGDGVEEDGVTEAAASGRASVGRGAIAGAQKQQQAPVVKIESLFDGLWMLPEEEQEEKEEEESEDEGQQASASAGAARVAGAGGATAAHGSVAAAAESALARVGGDGQGLGPGAEIQHDALDGLVADNLAVVASRAAALPLPRVQGSGFKGPRRGADDLYEHAKRGGVEDLKADFEALRPKLALSYPFELDVFQKEAVVHLEAGRSVFVAAHTSAGKTAVAEYALALATKHCSRAVYTSPIKTISNQKFRDFSSRFDVGLLTGDVQIKPEAPCLIMTTEILRSMLYKGADVVRDIEFVIFDEVHYVNDADRGVVWEEVIIMLPEHITIVMLSATVPNVMDFADWVGRTKRRVIYVTGTTKRPVPLEHLIYYSGELYPVCRGDMFIPDGIRKANLVLKRKNALPESTTRRDTAAARPTGRGDAGGGPNARGGGGGGRGGGRVQQHFGQRGGSADVARRQVAGYGGGGGGGASGANRGTSEKGQVLELVQLLKAQDLLPVAFFCFSKKRCDASTDSLAGLDLTTSVEKHAVHVFVEKCLTRLKEADRKLPQILRLRELMRRGLAVHHAGLLPIMKEVVEMLFCAGYIKVLFCTETFAMGVNAPTRTVVFHSLRKHDGKAFRNLLPGEYTQMAGRAGRRGLDTVGTVIVACWEDIPGESELKQMLTGRGVLLSSQFRLTYSMILNLLRVEDLKVEDMLKRSFSEFHAQRAQPEKLEALETGSKQLTVYRRQEWPECLLGCSREEISDYYTIGARIEQLNTQLQDAIMGSKVTQAFLVPGRVVLLHNPKTGITDLGMIAGGPDMDASSSSDVGSSFGTSIGRGIGGGVGRGGGSMGRGGGVQGSGTGADRKLWVLALHNKGPQDEEPGDNSAAVAKAAAAEEEFQGFVLKGKSDAAKPDIPGPLPRYGDVGGMSYMICEVPARHLVGICRAKMKLETPDVMAAGGSARGLAAAVRTLQQLRAESEQGEPELLDPRGDLKIADIDLVRALAERSMLLVRRAQMQPHRCPGTPAQYALVRSEAVLSARVAALQHELSDASLQQMPEFHQRVGILQRLGYVDDDGTVTLKGRAAVEVNSTQDELVATEMLFRGLLSGLEPEEAVALLSALVFQEKSEVEPDLNAALAGARADLEALVRECAEIQADAGLPISGPEYLKEVLHTGLMQVVYEWARGMPFADICELTDVPEGSIVRAVVRLDQACRELQDAARVMGNTALFSQMQAASTLIKRDVVFAASLYISQG